MHLAKGHVLWVYGRHNRDKRCASSGFSEPCGDRVDQAGVPAEAIVILTPSSESRSQWKKDDPLGNFIITWQLDTDMPMAARVCTSYRYKGLESVVIILIELHALCPEIRDPLL